MHWRITVEAVDPTGEEYRQEFLFEKDLDGLADGCIGCSIEDGKEIMHEIQKAVVRRELDLWVRYRRVCQCCGGQLPIKDYQTLKDQGYIGRGEITVISDGEDCLKRLTGMLPQPATHILDWFHISMKLQPLAQMALIAPEGYGLFEQDIDRIKWRLWNGQPKRALDLIAIVRKTLSSETGHCFWAQRADKLMEKLNTYISRNSRSVINYAERHRTGRRIATSPAEASVNALVAKRFVKKQQMRWSRTGAHYLLKVRAAMLNGDLSERTKYVPPKTDGSPHAVSLLNPKPPLLKAA